MPRGGMHPGNDSHCEGRSPKQSQPQLEIASGLRALKALRPLAMTNHGLN